MLGGGEGVEAPAAEAMAIAEAVMLPRCKLMVVSSLVKTDEAIVVSAQEKPKHRMSKLLQYRELASA